jgi:spore coat polysaccharide biosynthesis protein SpsF
MINYRGNDNALWTDDFAKRIMELHPDLKLVRYGFKYHVDGGHDLTFFLLEKGE